MAHRKAGPFHDPLTQGAADRARAQPSTADESRYCASNRADLAVRYSISARGVNCPPHNPAEPLRYQEQNRRESSLGLDKNKWHTGLNRRTCRLQHLCIVPAQGAETSISIFMDSRISRTSPVSTTSPSSTAHFQRLPATGLSTASMPSGTRFLLSFRFGRLLFEMELPRHFPAVQFGVECRLLGLFEPRDRRTVFLKKRLIVDQVEFCSSISMGKWPNGKSSLIRASSTSSTS